jgi:HSP20 family protein
MNLMRTRESRGLPATAAFEPFRLMRNLMRWDPYRDFGFPEDLATSSFMPSFDVKETQDAYVFTADMPGIRREDLQIELAGNRLTISGKREREEQAVQPTFYTQERSYGSFSRTFALPEEVESGKVVAELRDGVLHLMVPKSPEVRPQKIDIG